MLAIFLPPTDEERFSKIALRLKALLERRRFSAAYELCHHLKDTEMRITKQGLNDSSEVLANKFAKFAYARWRCNEVIEEIGLSTSTEINLDKIFDFFYKVCSQFPICFYSFK